MSRTFRRKNITKRGDIRAIHYLYHENAVYVGYWDKAIRHNWDDGRFDNYEDYVKDHIRKFHSDKDFAYVDYSSAPHWYNNQRERQYRRKVKNQIRRFMMDEEEDVFVDNRPIDSAWDYW